MDIRFAVIIIPDDAAEGKKQDGQGDKDTARRSDFGRQGFLRQLDAVEAGLGGDAAEQDDESRAGTDDQRIGKYAQRLDQSLFHRMRDMGRSRHVRCRTHTGFVAEQTPFDALHQCRADAAAQGLFPAEGIRDDQADHIRQFSEVEQDDAQGQDDITQRHDRNDHAAHLGNAVDAAEDDQQRHGRQDNSHPDRINAESLVPRRTDRIALHGVEGKTEGDGYQYGKKDAHPAGLQSFFHVIGRTAHERVFSPPFVKLGQRRFDKGTRRTDQGNDPHPEDRSRTAYRDGRGHACQIARPDTAGQ